MKRGRQEQGPEEHPADDGENAPRVQNVPGGKRRELVEGNGVDLVLGYGHVGDAIAQARRRRRDDATASFKRLRVVPPITTERVVWIFRDAVLARPRPHAHRAASNLALLASVQKRLGAVKFPQKRRVRSRVVVPRALKRRGVLRRAFDPRRARAARERVR